MKTRWFVLDLNPEPWAMGEASVGRGRGGGFFARISPNGGLVAYKNAVKEALEDVEPLDKGEYRLTLYLWRQQITYISNSDKRVTKHVADATNMQKALEDALQGVLFDNDRDVKDIRTVVVEQGKQVQSLIVIKAEMLQAFDPHELPDEIWDRIEKVGYTHTEQSELDYENAEELF